MLTTNLTHRIVITPVLLLSKCRPSEYHSWASTVGLASQGLHSGCTWLSGRATWALSSLCSHLLTCSDVRVQVCMRGCCEAPEMIHRAADTQRGLHGVSTCWVYVCLSSLVLPMEYHKIRDLKQHACIGSLFRRLEVWNCVVSWDRGVSRVRLACRSWGRMCSRPLPWRLLAPWPAVAQPPASHRLLLLCMPVFSVHVFPSL